MPGKNKYNLYYMNDNECELLQEREREREKRRRKIIDVYNLLYTK